MINKTITQTETYPEIPFKGRAETIAFLQDILEQDRVKKQKIPMVKWMIAALSFDYKDENRIYASYENIALTARADEQKTVKDGTLKTWAKRIWRKLLKDKVIILLDELSEYGTRIFKFNPVFLKRWLIDNSAKKVSSEKCTPIEVNTYSINERAKAKNIVPMEEIFAKAEKERADKQAKDEQVLRYRAKKYLEAIKAKREQGLAKWNGWTGKADSEKAEQRRAEERQFIEAERSLYRRCATYDDAQIVHNKLNRGLEDSTLSELLRQFSEAQDRYFAEHGEYAEKLRF